MTPSESQNVDKKQLIWALTYLYKLNIWHYMKQEIMVVHKIKKHQNIPFPKLKIHKTQMKENISAKYVGNFVSSSGGVYEIVEDRRTKGWGKVATIKCIPRCRGCGSIPDIQFVTNFTRIKCQNKCLTKKRVKYDGLRFPTKQRKLFFFSHNKHS